jgi:hypothetical protein
MHLYCYNDGAKGGPKPLKVFFAYEKNMYICNRKIKAEIAQLVEHDLAKVGVAGSSPVFRSNLPLKRGFFLVMPVLME